MKILHDMTSIPRKNPNPPDPRYATEYARESRWQADVERWFKQMGWRTYHTWGSMNSPQGYPDLTAILPGVTVIWAELKTEKGVLSDPQEQWLLDLAVTNQGVYLWRPSDTDEIHRLITECHQLQRQLG